MVVAGASHGGTTGVETNADPAGLESDPGAADVKSDPGAVGVALPRKGKMSR